jgi:hypothetical protein
MNFLQEMMGGQQKPTAQEMAGGIPQNADPGKAGLLGLRGGNGLLGLRGKPGGGAQMSPPPVKQDQAPMPEQRPAQLMPQDAPPAPVMAPQTAMQPMGGAPLGGMGMGGGMGMQGNPQMLQALLARRQAMQGQGAY